MQVWGLTDVGCTRAQNQDAFLIEKLDKHTLLCVVCDGMGGAKSGNIASTLAADVFVQQVKQSWSGDYLQGSVDKMIKDEPTIAKQYLDSMVKWYNDYYVGRERNAVLNAKILSLGQALRSK